MATSLRDIPGASNEPGRRRPRDAWHGLDEGLRPPVLFDPRQSLGGSGALGSRRRIGLLDGRRRRRRLSAFDTFLLVVVAAVALFLLRNLWTATRVDLDARGLARDDALTFREAKELDLRVRVSPTGGLANATITLDGRPLDDVERTDDGFRWRPDGGLGPGRHRLVLTVPRPILPASTFDWDFAVDAEPPRIRSPRVLPAHGMREPVAVAGRVDPDATLTANGKEVELDERGRFSLRYDHPPAGPISLVARDRAGYVVRREIFVPVKRPPVRGVHMSAVSWRTKELRDGVLALLESGRINTVELDLKDEGGEVGYDSQVPLANEIGAVKRYYRLEETVAELKRRGARVIGRVVAFRDPILATAAWERGNRDWVAQRPDGQPLAAYGGFTNLASPEVVRYNLDIALEGARAGMDEILWDYIRRPEGDLAQIRFPGMPSTNDAVERSVADFLARGHRLLRERGVFQGASLFGIAAQRPYTVGQNVPLISKHVDYVAPMVYPSLWVPGEYRVPDPPRMPFAIVTRSLDDFRQKAGATGAGVTAWLQDFTLGPRYGDAEVAEQIRAVEGLGLRDWLLWSPRVRYHAGRIPPRD